MKIKLSGSTIITKVNLWTTVYKLVQMVLLSTQSREQFFCSFSCLVSCYFAVCSEPIGGNNSKHG